MAAGLRLNMTSAPGKCDPGEVLSELHYASNLLVGSSDKAWEFAGGSADTATWTVEPNLAWSGDPGELCLDAELARVRLMWRRGGGRYRPMVRPDVDPNDLEEAPMSDWDANELPDAHPEWSGPNPLESVEQGRARVRKMGAHFWRIALDWTRANGPICDVQLRGYTRDGGVLFEEGKRCNLAAGSRRSTSASEGLPVVERERVEHRREPTEHERERLEHERDFQARREARLMADVHQIHHTYGDLLGSLKRERDEAIGLTQETIRLVPDLFAEASKVIRDSLDHHRAQVRETVANATGKREYEFHAYSEQQETARHDRTIGFLIEAVQVGVGTWLGR